MAEDIGAPAPGWTQAADGGWHPPGEQTATRPAGKARPPVALIAFGVLAAVVSLVALTGRSDPEPKRDPLDNPGQARRHCEDSVGARLQFPASATFHGQIVEQDTSDDEGNEAPGRYRVVGSVDAVTGAAIFRTSRWTCDATYSGAGEYDVEARLLD